MKTRRRFAIISLDGRVPEFRIRLLLKVWIAAENDAVAIRQKVQNAGQTPLFLNELNPLYCKGEQGLFLAKAKNASNWDVLIQQRLKNGRPQTIQPSGNDTYEIDQFIHIQIKKGIQK